MTTRQRPPCGRLPRRALLAGAVLSVPLSVPLSAPLSTSLVLSLSLALGGCGFELRRAPELAFQSIRLVGFKPRTPLAEALRRSIDASTTTRVVEGGAPAQVVLEAVDDVREKVVVAISSVGRVTEFRLRERFVFEVRSSSGRELVPRTELVLTRDLSYTESAALAKEQEEAFLFQAMQSDIVAQVMRRLAAVQLPPG